MTNAIVFPGITLVDDVEAYCSDIEDDLIIGMDIISLTDFVITNIDGNTHFSMRAPAEGVEI